MSVKLNSKKDGFTLSEVLIALIVIEVIAAITLPVITANHRREEASARVKKFCSMLLNALTRAKADGKDWGYWAETGSESIESFAKNYLLPYISYNKTKTSDKFFYIYFNDGTYMTIHRGICAHFIVDVNGEKKPNTHGRDKHGFLYCPDTDTGSYYFKTEQIIPYLYKSITTREGAVSQCKIDAATCTGLLMMDNWEFKKDYPFNI